MATTKKRGGWEHLPEQDAWVKNFKFDAVFGWSKATMYGVAVRRERMGSKMWRADLRSIMGFEALTPTKYPSATAAKKAADAIFAEFAKLRRAGQEVDVQDVAHRVWREGGSRDPAFRGASRDRSRSESGVTLRKVDGEYQTKPAGAGSWSTGKFVNYTTDLDDAIATVIASAKNPGRDRAQVRTKFKPGDAVR